MLFISDCLEKLGTARTVPTRNEGLKMLNTVAVDNFSIPGDANFPLNAHYAPPGDRVDRGTSYMLYWLNHHSNYWTEYLRSYLSQVRQELAIRLVDRLYPDGSTQPSKWWMAFQKRRFMHRSLAR